MLEQIAFIVAMVVTTTLIVATLTFIRLLFQEEPEFRDDLKKKIKRMW
jgi:hypothetical protein